MTEHVFKFNESGVHHDRVEGDTLAFITPDHGSGDVAVVALAGKIGISAIAIAPRVVVSVFNREQTEAMRDAFDEALRRSSVSEGTAVDGGESQDG